MLIEEITTTPNSIKQQLLNCYQQNEWRPHDLDEAQDFDVRFLDSPMFAETFKQKTSSNLWAHETSPKRAVEHLALTAVAAVLLHPILGPSFGATVTALIDDC